jgi:hypothetical protein
MIEFALVVPVFLLLLVGVIEFGGAYTKIISLRQGVREAGRQASVANFGGNTACSAFYTAPLPSVNVQKLVCLTKDQSGIPDTVRVFVKFKGPDPTAPGSGPYIQGNSIVVCAIQPLQALTGLMQPFLSGHYARTKAAFRVEQVTQPPQPDADSGEDPPPGQDWSFCT